MDFGRGREGRGFAEGRILSRGCRAVAAALAVIAAAAAVATPRPSAMRTNWSQRVRLAVPAEAGGGCRQGVCCGRGMRA
eukprot:SAG22_NODE_2907_length_2113_cov_2.397219_3_plen_79_part_00